MFSQLFSRISELIHNILVSIIDILPDSPIQQLAVNPTISKYLGYINWVIPINFMVSTLLPWLTAIAIYYAYSVIMRWAKAIS